MCELNTQAYNWSEVHTFLSVFGAARNPAGLLQCRPNHDARRRAPRRWRPAQDRPDAVRGNHVLLEEDDQGGAGDLQRLGRNGPAKPLFREAFKRRRCILGVTGSFDFRDEPYRKQPHLFSASDGPPILGVAGLRERWRDPATGDDLLSCTMIVSGVPIEWTLITIDASVPAEKNFDRSLAGTAGMEVPKPNAESACGNGRC